MHKYLRSAAALLTLFAMLVSCNRQPDPPKDDDDSAPSATAQTSVTTAPITTVPPETQPPETLPPTEEAIDFPAWEGREDIELVATSDPLLGDVRAISQHGDRMLISYAFWDEAGVGMEAAHAQVLDLKTGELSQPILLSRSMSIATFLDNGNICVYDQYGCVAEVYDPEGKKQYTFICPNDSMELYLDPSGDGTLWTFSWGSSTITRVPLSGEPLQTIQMPMEDGGYIMGHRDGMLYYSAWNDGDACVFSVDARGDVEYIAEASRYYWGGGYFFTDSLPNCILDPEAPDSFYQIGMEEAFDWIEVGDGTKVLTQNFTETEGGEYQNSLYQVLDYENGLLYPGLECNDGRFYSSFSFADDGTLYFFAGEYDDEGMLIRSELCRWAYAHDPDAVSVQKVKYESLEPSIKEVADRIEQNWGVKVYYQPELIHQVATDYRAMAITDLQLLYTHIVQLEATLANYPAGFFEDICYGDYTHLEIYLCGEFTPLTDAGIESAEALATTRYNALVIGVNVYYLDGEYTRVLAHELMHIMEHRMDGIDFDILTAWIDLTPGGYDAYYFSYHHADGEEMNDYSNTYYSEPDPEDAYFVDAYSKSFPTEDRARIFEKLMESGGEPFFADSPVMMAKAEFLCEVIREYFPSVAAVERAMWEIK